MSSSVAGALQIAVLVALLAVAHRPLGDHMHRSFTSAKHLRVERAFSTVTRVDPDADQRWSTYLLSVLGFSAVSVLFLYAMLRLQDLLPLALGLPGLPPDGAFNTAVSFVTNTNWQWYSGEAALGHTAQMAGLTVQNFLSAAVGMAVVVALVRGFSRSGTDRVGNFWVDLTRATVRILLPIAVVGAVVMMAAGVVQNLDGPLDIGTLTGGTQSLPGGPVASQEVIKQLGTNGGGFYNANSAHPFESPTPFTNLLQVFVLLLIPSAMPRVLGRMVGDTRQGYAILATMGVLWLAAAAATIAFEVSASGSVPEAVGAATEGKEVRFGVVMSALFASSTTGTSTGAVNSLHDSFTGGGGGVVLFNIMLGEVSPGGVGAGLYGMLVLAVIAIFLAGLMVGRTPEYLGKKLGRREVSFAALYVLAMPFALLVGAGIAIALPSARESIQEPRHPRTVGGAVRVRVGVQQQRQRLRGPDLGDAVLQHGPRAVHARRPVRPDRPRACPGRVTRGPAPHPGWRGHPAEPRSATGAAALEQAADRNPDVVVLDLGLPDMDGIDVIAGLRGWTRVPIIVLSARHDSHDKVEALDAGADDFVTKPFAMDELLARLRAAVRRAAPVDGDDDEGSVQAGELVIDLARKKVARAGADVRLTPTEWNLLEVLVRHAGRLVAQKQLLQEVWGPAYGTESNYLRVYTAQLRRKLEADPSHPVHLITEPGMGYRFETG